MDSRTPCIYSAVHRAIQEIMPTVFYFMQFYTDEGAVIFRCDLSLCRQCSSIIEQEHVLMLGESCCPTLAHSVLRYVIGVTVSWQAIL
jgi:hypothetical protein